MTVVIDASVVVAALVDSSRDGLWAESIIEQHALLAPEFLLLEVMNVLRRLEANRVIEQLTAAQCAQDAMMLPVQLVPINPVIGRVWALRHNYSSYDAAYVATAESFQIPLATLDVRLTKQQSACVFLTP